MESESTGTIYLVLVFLCFGHASIDLGSGMLIIGRKRLQKIIISDDIEITILEIGRNRVRFGIQAPKDVRVHTRLQDLPGDEPTEEPAEANSPRAFASRAGGKH